MCVCVQFFITFATMSHSSLVQCTQCMRLEISQPGHSTDDIRSMLVSCGVEADGSTLRCLQPADWYLTDKPASLSNYCKVTGEMKKLIGRSWHWFGVTAGRAVHYCDADVVRWPWVDQHCLRTSHRHQADWTKHTPAPDYTQLHTVRERERERASERARERERESCLLRPRQQRSP